MSPAANPFIHDGVERLRLKWPQSHAVPGEHGRHLVVVPSVRLPVHFDKTICTVLFVVPPGFPASFPSNFLTDIEIRIDGKAPHWTNMRNAEWEVREWPQWRGCQWWGWKLQQWNPNCCSLVTYANVVRRRFAVAR